MAARGQMLLHGIPRWAIKGCRRIATWRGFVWTNLVSLALGVLGTWLTSVGQTNISSTSFDSLLAHWWVCGAVLGTSEVIFGLSTILSRFPEMEKSLRRIQKEYLKNVITQKERLKIEGVPAPLIYEAVALEAIFILPRFRPHKSLVDQGVSEKLRERLRAGITSGEVAPEVEKVLIERARMYEQQPDWDQVIGIEDLWLRLSRKEPAAVIQGTPGMGKSTLLMRLALHMARRGLGEGPFPTFVAPGAR